MSKECKVSQSDKVRKVAARLADEMVAELMQLMDNSKEQAQCEAETKAVRFLEKFTALLEQEPKYRGCALAAIIDTQHADHLECVVLRDNKDLPNRELPRSEYEPQLLKLRQKGIANISVDFGEKPTVKVSGGNHFEVSTFINNPLLANAEIALEEIEPFPVNRK